MKIISSKTEDSIFFKIYSDNNIDIHLEYFFNYDKENKDDIESIISIHKKNQILLKTCGELKEVCDIAETYINKKFGKSLFKRIRESIDNEK